MTATLNSTGVAYGDSTQQNSAWIGGRGQVFTASGTFTVPTGVTAVKVTVVGGGGGSANGSGASGGSGGTSSFGAYVSATGGTGGNSTNFGYVAGGTGTGGQINETGGYGGPNGGGAAGFGGDALAIYDSTYTDIVLFHGNGKFGKGGINPVYGNVGSAPAAYNSPNGYGSGAQTNYAFPGGGGGGVSTGYVTGLTPGASITVTVGAGGTAAPSNGYAGLAGIVIVEW